MKINWFCPLPPARTGIAVWAAKILPYVAAKHDLRLFAAQAVMAENLKQFGPLIGFDSNSPPWFELNSADLNVYHIGNNREFHADILEMSRLHPGIVILHDLRLHDLIWTTYVDQNRDQKAYLEAMDRWYGADGLRAGQEFIAGGHMHREIADEMAQRYPLAREVVNGALGVITHSAMALEEMGEEPDCPARALEFPHTGIPDHAYREIAAARRDRVPPYRILIFGYIQPNRRVIPMLEAYAKLEERSRFRLDICGELWDKSVVLSVIERLGLRDLVNLRGHLAEHDVSRAFAEADIAINLRNPTMGEASLSQMEFWEFGLPTLVTRTGWYASLPEDSVCFVDPDRETEDIQRHLRHFLANPQSLHLKGEAGRRALASHHPEKYAQGLSEFAEEIAAAPQLAAGLKLATRTGLEMRQWLQTGMSELMMNRTSVEICEIFGPGPGWKHRSSPTSETSSHAVRGSTPPVARSPEAVVQAKPQAPVTPDTAARLPEPELIQRPGYTEPPIPATGPLNLRASKAISRMVTGPRLIGEIPPGPPTVRAAIGKRLIEVIRRCLFWLIPPIQAFQRDVAAAAKEQVAAIEDLARSIEETRTDLGPLAAAIAGLRSQILDTRQKFVSEIAGLGSSLAQLRESSEQECRALRAEIEPLVRSAPRMDKAFEMLGQIASRVSALEEYSRRTSAELDMPRATYVEFQNRFRGSFEDIHERLKVYLGLPAFRGAARILAPFVDLGCGRGEWLALLRERNISAYGVDSNPVMVEACVRAGLMAQQDDLLTHLRSLSDESRGGITAFHVVEHLPPVALGAMLDESLRVLVPGGVAILETPNPANLFVSTRTFHLDPTHRKPIPPELLRFLLESRGFTGIEIVPLHAFPPEAILNLPGDQAAEFINAHFFGPQDYGAVCRKPLVGPR